MANIPLVASTAANAEASQIIGTLNGVIQNINSNALIGSQAPTSLRNIVIGGDFSTNPWQRGTTSATITNTLTYTADRFWALGGASSAIVVSKQTASTPVGFGAKLRFQRTAANADLTAINLGYVVETLDTTQMQGQPFVLSFWAQAGANFSAASSALSLSAATGTGTDEGATAFAAGSWTGNAAVTLIGSAGTTVTSVTLTTSWQRFAVSGFIPTTATEFGFKIGYTPVGTAGASDLFEIAGVQLEVMPQGGVNPTPFERRPPSMELALCQRYTEVISETTGVATQFVANGYNISSTVANIGIPFKVRKRVAPTITYPTLGAGGFSLQNTVGTKVGTATMTQFATSTVDAAYAQATVTSGLTASAPSALVGTGQGSSITISAEL